MDCYEYVHIKKQKLGCFVLVLRSHLYFNKMLICINLMNSPGMVAAKKCHYSQVWF